MKLLLCSAVLATALIGVYGFPTDSAESDVSRKGGNPNNKPLPAGVEKPRPSLASKPAPQVSDNLQAAQSPSPATFVMDVAQSSVSSEFPSADVPFEAASEIINNPVHLPASEPSHDPILEAVENFHVPEAVVQDALPEAPAAIEPEVLSADHAIAGLPSDAAEAPEVEAVADVEAPLELDTKVAAFIAGKTRRHAGVEKPTALRIGDFEDVESESGLAAPEYPAHHEQIEMAPGISKEEMILMAMEQGGHPNLPHMQLSGSGPRPSKGRPTLMHTNPVSLNSGSIHAKPHFQNSFEDDEEAEAPEDDDQTVDLRNADEPATIVQEQPAKQIAKVNADHVPQVSQTYGSGSRNKPRPYGMDRPSKNRPTLDSGMKDKNEHFGLPHSSSSSNDYVQKGESGLTSSDSGTTSYLGFQIPSIKWTSFTDLWGLPNFWGNRNRHHDMGKSDQAMEEPCVDDEESAGDGVRSPVIQGNTLCHASGVSSTCHAECVDKGFASGSCLGPYPTPGCLCRKPQVHAQSKDIGLMLRPLEVKSEDSRVQDLETSVSTPCKKCACMESCKQSGSFTGFCVDRCYCAVPWSLKEEE